MKTTLYHTALDQDPERFDKHINKLLSEGWILHGNPYAVMETVEGGDIKGYLCQALVKTSGN